MTEPLGEFRLLREIGRGGMGVVYEAEQTSLGRRVALKVLAATPGTDGKQLARFQIEAQVAAALNHPHIVPIFAVGCDRGVHYYAMQLIEGRCLAEVLRDPGPRPGGGAASVEPRGQGEETNPRSPFSPRAAAQLAMQAAQALEHAHGLGVLHRDIKPGNLLVDGRGHLWIADFGLARFQGAGDLTLTGDLLGTLRYMSPEQAAGRANPRPADRRLLAGSDSLRAAHGAAGLRRPRPAGAPPPDHSSRTATAAEARPDDPARPRDDRAEGDGHRAVSPLRDGARIGS